jgi:hypothetical protein
MLPYHCRRILCPQKKTCRFAILWVSDIIRATLLPPKHCTKIVIVKSTIDPTFCYSFLKSTEILACHTGTENTCRTRRGVASSGTRYEKGTLKYFIANLFCVFFLGCFSFRFPTPIFLWCFLNTLITEKKNYYKICSDLHNLHNSTISTISTKNCYSCHNLHKNKNR